MKKVLIVTYYWPPSGGAGVQRWLKLSKYLAMQGIEVHILTVDPKSASYLTIDNSLTGDIHEKVKVHQTKSFEIINYYSKLVGKKNVPTAGFSNVNNNSILQKAVNALRSNLFIPDPRIGWKKYAVKKALELIEKENISTIITTSPPHSTHLIGYELKKKKSIKWLVDLRDPWTDIYYYSLLGHSKLSKQIDKSWEKKILLNSDDIITVSKGFKSIFLTKSDKIPASKIKIIPNGYDTADFKHDDLNNKVENSDNDFVVCYTGTMSDQYDPMVFFDALNTISEKVDTPIKVRLVGIVSENIRLQLTKMKYQIELVDTVPHSEVNSYQRNSDLLLLIIPDTGLANGITPGKLFEYLATKNKIIAIGPENSDVNRILLECNAGRCFERDSQKEIEQFLNKIITDKLSGKTNPTNEDKMKKYSRENQAKEIAQLL